MAVQFNGSTDKLSRTTTLPSSTSFTATFWLYATAALTTDYQYAFGIEDATSSSSNWTLFGHNNTANALGFSSSGTPGEGNFSTANSAINTWHYCTLRCNGTGSTALEGRIFAAGANTWAQTLTAAGVSYTVAHIVLGNDSYGEQLNCRIANVKVYSAYLTPDEMLSESHSYLPKRTANLIAWLPFVDTAASTFIDYSGNGNFTQAGTVDTNIAGPPIAWGAPTRRIFIPAAGAVGVSVTPTGVSSTSGIGTLSSLGAALTTPTGVSSTSGIGTVASLGAALVTPSGVSATGQIGTLSGIGAALAALTGVSSASAIGTLTVLADGLIHHWKLDGTATDAIGSWNLTAEGTPGYVAGGAPNKDQAALLIPASNQFFWTDNDLTGLAGLTITGWAYPKSNGTIVSSFYDAGSTNRQLWLFLNGAGTITLTLRTNDTTEVWTTTVSTEELALNQWQFFAVVFDGSGTNVKLIIDQSAALDTLSTWLDETTSGGTISAPADGSADFAIGEARNASTTWLGVNEFDGRIDDVRIYNTVLNSTQLEAVRDDDQGIQGVTQELIGQVAAGAVGTVTILTGDVQITLTGVESTSAIGTLTAIGAASVTLTGVSSTTAIGTLTAIGAANITLTGNSATGQIGTAAAIGGALVTLAGVVATGAAGAVTVVVAGGVSVTLTGVQSTTAIGTATATGAASLTLAGVSTATAIGTLQTLGASDITLTGVAATGQLGTPGAIGAALLTLADVAATGQIGNITVVVAGGVSVTLSGVESASGIGTMTGQGGALLTLPGVSATGSPGDLTAVISQLVTLAGVSATAQVGVMAEVTGALLTLQGVLATGQVGSVTIPLPADQAGELLGTITITAALASDADEAITVTPSLTATPTLH